MKRRKKQGAAAAASPPQASPAPAPPSTPSSSSSAIPIGTRVELHGLKAKMMNRQRGIVAGIDADSGRYEVKLEDGQSFKVKVENMKI